MEPARIEFPKGAIARFDVDDPIARTNAATWTGPPTTLAPLDVEETLRRFWRARHAPR